MDNATYVGLDVHKNEHTVAVYAPGSTEPEVFAVNNAPAGIRKLARKLLGEACGPVEACYEAGVLGFSLQRQLQALGLTCRVIAPSLIPRRPGQRICTDRRDAQQLGAYLRAGMLTEVHPPRQREESVRDLCRWREAAQRDLLRVRHQVLKFLLRRGVAYEGGKTHWTSRHHQWLRTVGFAEALDQEVFTAMLLELEHRRQRVEELDRRLGEVAVEEPYRQAVGWLCCLRGIKTVTALSVAAELHGFQRFGSARELMSYLGLVPSENSSGLTQRKGRITKSGNGRVRRLLVEAAWHQVRVPVTSKELARRRQGQPAWAVKLAETAQRRLHRRYWRLVHQGKLPAKAATAVARELAGFLWGMLRLREQSAGPEADDAVEEQAATAESRPAQPLQV